MGTERSPARIKREKRSRAAEERRWAARSGPVRTIVAPKQGDLHSPRPPKATEGQRTHPPPNKWHTTATQRHTPAKPWHNPATKGHNPAKPRTPNYG